MIFRLAVSVVVIAFVALTGCGERSKKLPDSAFQVAFESHNVPSQMQSGKTISVDVRVKNISPVVWPSKPDSKERYAVTLSYHWLGPRSVTVVLDGLRTPLPRDLKPGESVDLKATIQAPEKPGKYTLEVTLVQERNAWFPEKDGGKLTLPVIVTEASETTSSERSEKPQPEAVAKTSKSATSDDRSSGSWSVQLGSYADKKVAANLAKKLKDKGYDAYVTAVTVKGKEVHRVRVGHFTARADAEKLRETLRTVEKQQRAVVTSG
jgi:cell division septation protein DedD